MKMDTMALSGMIKFTNTLGLLGLLLLARGAPAAGQTIAGACTPGVSFWSLLDAVNISYTGGYLQLKKMYAVCLPQPSAPGDSVYVYNPDGGGKLSTLVKDANGQTLTTYVWSAEKISSLWEMSSYKVLGGEQSIKPLSAGSYTLEFQVEGKTFYRFPFSVDTLPSDDPYRPPGTTYFIDGPWSDYGNLFYQRNDPQSSLQFTVWVKNKAGHPQQKSAPYVAELVQVRDGRVIAHDQGELRADQQWRQLDVNFKLDVNTNTSMKAAALLAEDGAYRVRFSMDGKLHGTYPFIVSGGKIQLQGRQLDSTPTIDRITDYLYGGRYRSWWLPRDATQIAH
jgi:hypothetical protein